MLARGLCRSCYDAQPDQLKRRVFYNTRAQGRVTNYKDTPEFKEYVRAYKQTDAYKKWKAEYMRQYWLENPEAYERMLAKERENYQKNKERFKAQWREYYYRKKRGVQNDS